MTTAEQQPSPFPVGGPRQPVYDALRTRGFVMCRFGDKQWNRRDGLEVHVYGAGSRLMVFDHKREELADGPMAESLKRIDDLDAAIGKGTP